MECDGFYELQRELVPIHLARIRALVEEIQYRTEETRKALERLEEAEQRLALGLHQFEDPPF